MRFVRNLLALSLTALALGATAQAQPVGDAEGDVGIGTLEPAASSILDLTSTTKGFLVPRMTTLQRNAIAAPADALMIFNLTTRQFEYYDAFALSWQPIGSGGGAFWALTGNFGTTTWDGVTGNYLGTNDAQDLAIVTRTANAIDFWTNNAQVAVIDAAGNMGINEMAPSARLDVVEGGAQSAIEATNNGTGDGITAFQTALSGGGNAIHGEIASTDANAFAIEGVVTSTTPGGFSAGVRGINNGTGGLGIGVYGSQSGSGWGVYGTTPTGIGVHGNSANGFGVYGLSNIGTGTYGISTSGIGVFGESNTGTAGQFTTTGPSAASTVIINDNTTGSALEVNANGVGLGIDLNNGALDGNAAANFLGAGTAAQQLTIRGVANAVVGNTLAGNPTVWDLVITGDEVVTGIAKFGGSIWIDGVSPTHNIQASAPLDITTTGGASGIRLAAGNNTTTVDDNLIVNGTINQTGAGQVTFSGNVDANNGLDVFNQNLTVNSPSTIQALGAGHVMGTAGVNTTKLTINGLANSLPYELIVNGDAQITGLLSLSSMTPGSVIFAGPAGQLSQDNANFFFDDVNNRLGLGDATPDARLDVTETGAVPAIEASTTGTGSVATFTLTNAASVADAVTVNTNGLGNGIVSRKTGGSGLIPGAVSAVLGDAAGTATGVTGLSTAGMGVFGGTLTGTAAMFSATAGANPTVQINDGSTGAGLLINSNGAGLGIDLNNGALDGDAAANFLGNGAAAQQLTVRGSANAVVGNTLAGNPTVWDLVVNGDVVATGLVKVGGSMWLDGTSATHNLQANAPLDITTTGGASGIRLAAGNNTTTVDDNLVVNGTINQTGGGTVTFSGATTVNGIFDANTAGNQIGNGLNAEQLEINGVNGGADELDVNGDVDVSGDLAAGTITLPTFTAGSVIFAGPGGTLAQDNAALNFNDGTNMLTVGNETVNGTSTVLGTSDLQNAVSNSTGNNGGAVAFGDNIVPTGVSSLGTDAARWSEVYVLGTSIHLGPNNGEAGNTELNMTYAGSLGAIDVDGGTDEIVISPAVVSINTLFNANADMGVVGVAQFGNDVMVGGQFVANDPNSQMGDGTDAMQLTVNGVNGGAIDMQVIGDLDITGALTAGSFTLPPLSSDLDLNGNDIVDNIDGIVGVDDDLQVTGSADVDGGFNADGAATFGSTMNVTGATVLGGNATLNGNAEFNGSAQFDGATTFNASSTWNSGSNITLNNGTITANKTAAGSAIAINNTNATTAIALNVAPSGGRTILSYGTGAGNIPSDVSVWNATGNVTLPASTENGQVLYVVNSTGGAITVTGAVATAAGFNSNDVRGYIYAGGWYELP